MTATPPVTSPTSSLSSASPPHSPLEVQLTRGGIDAQTTESTHRVSFALVHADGEVLAAGGDVHHPIFARSAVKPFQALALVEAMASDPSAYTCLPEEIALACASHHGEPQHVETARAWLAKIGCSDADLECGQHWPSAKPAARALGNAGKTPNPLHNNCSGKHIGMLTTALARGWETNNYVHHQHNVQTNIAAIIEHLCDVSLAGAPVGIDGCSAPTYAIPLGNLALGAARFASGHHMPAARTAATKTILHAMGAFPELVGGSNHMVSRLLRMGASPSPQDGRMQEHAEGVPFALKNGAEGVYLAWFPAHACGLALKCHDGAMRGADAGLLALLHHWGFITQATIDAELNLPHKNWQGREVGTTRWVMPDNVIAHLPLPT
ncbi:MAG: asparaginase [Alphaproteobacteria bacterium]|nr:asparaginase [Alphaproteobacteria bacterium]